MTPVYRTQGSSTSVSIDQPVHKGRHFTGDLATGRFTVAALGQYGYPSEA